MEKHVKLFEEFINQIDEAYDGNLSDFQYELGLALDNELGISPDAIKKVSKKGKGFEVRMSSYMSNKSAWEKLGAAIGATLIDFKPGSINIGIYESIVTEATSYDPDDIFFLWDDYVDNGREGIERGHVGSGSNQHELFTFDTDVDGYDKFETELKKLLKKSGWKNEYSKDTLKVYESSDAVINESLSSSILSGILNLRYADNDLFKYFYNTAKIQLDKVQDSDIITTTPNEAYRWKGNGLVFYVSTREKENPYAPDSRTSIIPANTLLAIASGDNKFMGTKWTNWGGKTLSKLDKVTQYNSGVGIKKPGSGWDATGLFSVKRISEVADVAYIVDLDALRANYSTQGVRTSRSAARSGATAMISDKDFKLQNMARYKEIIATRYENDDIDGEVQRAIENATSLITAGIRKMDTNGYGEISFGKSKRGNHIRMSDISNWMSNLMNDYERYVRYSNDSHGNDYYAKEKKNYALSIKDKIEKFKKNDIGF
jgi:hypothetical protein